MQHLYKDGIKPKGGPLNINHGLTDSYYKKGSDLGVGINQILLSGISAEQLIELLRPMVREEMRRVMSEQEEKLLSPAETCKLFKPAITKATLTSWTKQGLLQEYRIGGRVFYRQSQVFAAAQNLSKYKSIYEV